MKIIVHEDRTLEILNQATTQNENNVEIIDFEFPEIYENWNKKIVFVVKNEPVLWDIIQDNQYMIQKNITKNEQIDIYIWLTHEDKDFRTETKPLYFNLNADASDQITEEELNAVNKILAEVDAALEEVDNVDINIQKNGEMTTVTIYKKDGTSKSANILDGQKGEPGYTPQKGIDYYTEEDKNELENDINNDLAQYINQPFIEFQIRNGNLIMEVKEYGN